MVDSACPRTGRRDVTAQLSSDVPKKDAAARRVVSHGSYFLVLASLRKRDDRSSNEGCSMMSKILCKSG